MNERKTEKQTVGWFMGLPDHPRQRDTARHAAKAAKRHLADTFVTHDRVVAAKYRGKWYKVDGHTRAYLWENGQLRKPTHVTVDKYWCSTKAEFDRLYKAFDNMGAAENARDLAFGILQEAGITEMSSLVANSAAQVSRMLITSLSERNRAEIQGEVNLELLQFWVPEITHVNNKALAGERQKLHSAFLAAEIVTCRKYGCKASDAFWDRFYARDGYRRGKVVDPVEALWCVYEERKRHGLSRTGSRGTSNTMALMGLALYYFEGARTPDKEYRNLRRHVQPTYANKYVRAFIRDDIAVFFRELREKNRQEAAVILRAVP